MRAMRVAVVVTRVALRIMGVAVRFLLVIVLVIVLVIMLVAMVVTVIVAVVVAAEGAVHMTRLIVCVCVCVAVRGGLGVLLSRVRVSRVRGYRVIHRVRVRVHLLLRSHSSVRSLCVRVCVRMRAL